MESQLEFVSNTEVNACTSWGVGALVFGGFLSGLPADVKRAHTFFFRVIDSDAEVCVQVWWSR